MKTSKLIKDLSNYQFKTGQDSIDIANKLHKEGYVMVKWKDNRFLKIVENFHKNGYEFEEVKKV